MQQPTCHWRFSDAAALSLKACCGESPLPTGQLALPEPCPASRARPGAGSLRCRFTCNDCAELRVTNALCCWWVLPITQLHC